MTMPATPTITTIIPTYQRPRLLRRAICSALGQSYSNVRVCVYDNASGDETEAVVTSIAQNDSRVHFFRHTGNVGYVNNIIHGLREAATPYFSILSDDDVLTPWFYETAMAGFARHPDAMFSAMDAVKISHDHVILAGPLWPETNQCRSYAQGEAFEGVAKGQIPVPWVGTVFRREVIDEIGAPNPDAGPHLNDDLILHAAARYACIVSEGIGCLVTESSNSVGARMQALNADWLLWLRTVLQDIITDPQVAGYVRRQARRLVVHSFRRIALQQVVQGLGHFGHRNSDYARQAAIGVGECGHPMMSTLLRLTVWLHANFPPLRAVFGQLVRYRKGQTAEQRSNLTQKYAHLVDYLNSFEKNIPVAVQTLNRSA